MQETQKKSYAPLIAGALFALLLLLQLIQTARSIRYMTALGIIASFIYMGAYAVLAFSLLTRRRDILLCVGFALLSVDNLYSFFFGLSAFRYTNPIYAIIRSFSSLLSLVGTLAMLLFCVVYLTGFLPQFRNQLRNLWFVPAAVIVFAKLVGLLNSILFMNLLNAAGIIAATFFACVWIVYPAGLPNQAPASSENSAVRPVAEFYCSLVKHILLLLFTFGVWLYMWIYRITGFTNHAKGEEYRDPTIKLLLCMFVPFYQIYWTYVTAQRIDKMAADKGVSSELATMCLILAIFVPIIPPILLQDKINALVTAPAGVHRAAPEAPKKTVETKYDTVDELKRYKELLDSGVITQEDYDAKKKQLLGL